MHWTAAVLPAGRAPAAGAALRGRGAPSGHTAAARNSPPAAAVTSIRGSRRREAVAIPPGDLRVKLEALEAPRPDSKGVERNPFRFYVKPPPPPPVSTQPRPTVVAPPVSSEPPGPPPPPSLPPIAMKYIGYMDTPGGKIANFSDCRRPIAAAGGRSSAASTGSCASAWSRS